VELKRPSVKQRKNNLSGKEKKNKQSEGEKTKRKGKERCHPSEKKSIEAPHSDDWEKDNKKKKRPVFTRRRREGCAWAELAGRKAAL